MILSRKHSASQAREHSYTRGVTKYHHNSISSMTWRSLLLFQVFFQDVFAEPEGSYSIDGVWRTSFTAFVNTKYWCYRIITAVLGIPTAVLCGMYFACLSFDYIWCVTPCLRAYIIELQCLGKIFGLCLRTFCDPFFESVSRIFSGIKISSQKV